MKISSRLSPKPSNRLVATLLVLVSLWAMPAVQGSPAATSGNRPRIGLALSGGGARGAAHIGVLEVIERLHIPIDYIAGTSMGAVVGGLYASGLSPEEIEDAIESIDWVDIFEDEPPRRERRYRRKQDDQLSLIKQRPGVKEQEREIDLVPALIQGQKFDLELRKLTLPVRNLTDFDRLRIPFRAVATDVVTGQAVILGSGDLAEAIRASMAIPAVFAPVEIGDKLLVDGGIAMNLPVSLVRDMGADIVIGVDISSPRRGREDITDVLEMLDQIASLVTWRNTELQLASMTERDVLIVPPLGDQVLTGDFDKLARAIEIGEQGATAIRPQLARLSLSSSAYAAYREQHRPPAHEIPRIDYVRVENNSRLSDELIKRRLDISPGDPLDTDKLEADIATIYDMDNFQRVAYRLEQKDGRTGVVIEAEEKIWGTSYIQGGLDLSSTLDGDSFFNIGATYTLLPVNRWNGEWRTLLRLGEESALFTELYQPLDPRERWYLDIGVGYLANNVFYFTGDSQKNPEAEYNIARWGLLAEAGRNLGRWGRAALTYRRFIGDADVLVGAPSVEGFDFNQGELEIALLGDTLDDLGFPTQGWNGFAYGRTSQQILGADEDFQQAGLGFLGAWTWGRNSFNLGGRYQGTLDDDAPIQNLFRTGGFLNLSGFNQNQLSGQHEGLLRLAYLRNLGTGLVPTYLGASLEWGGAWQNRSDIGLDTTRLAGSLFVGADTFLGPIYGAYGHAEGGEQALYLFLGNPWRIWR